MTGYIVIRFSSMILRMVRNPGAWEFRKKGKKYDLNKLYMDIKFSKDSYVQENYKKQQNATILKYDFVVRIMVI